MYTSTTISYSLLFYIIIVASLVGVQYRTARNGESLYWNCHYLLWGNRLAVVRNRSINVSSCRMLSQVTLARVNTGTVRKKKKKHVLANRRRGGKGEQQMMLMMMGHSFVLCGFFFPARILTVQYIVSVIMTNNNNARPSNGIIYYNPLSLFDFPTNPSSFFSNLFSLFFHSLYCNSGAFFLLLHPSFPPRFEMSTTFALA